MSDAYLPAEGTPTRARGLWSDAGHRLHGNRVVLTAAGIIVLLALVALFGPTLSPYADDTLDWKNLGVSPQLEASHWLGTDGLGRDLFVRTLHGVRISLLISLLASAVSLVIGVAWGSVAGYVGGRTDEWMMRFVDVLYSLPYLFIVIILTTVFARGSLTVLLIAIGAVGWLTTARIVRGQTLALKRREFIEAARHPIDVISAEGPSATRTTSHGTIVRLVGLTLSRAPNAATTSPIGATRIISASAPVRMAG